MSGEGTKVWISAWLFRSEKMDREVFFGENDVGVGQDVACLRDVVANYGVGIGNQPIAYAAHFFKCPRLDQCPVVGNHIRIGQR